MCGLSGLLALRGKEIARPGRVQASLKAIGHRGNDQQGVVIEAKFAVCHARLAILDLSAAAGQPWMEEGGDWMVLHNGEIFNYLEIRKKLEQKGFTFKSRSDTEVIIKAFRHYGPAVFQMLDGFFATVIFDRKADTWYLARDRSGVKPLYYSMQEDSLVFSSEMKGLFALEVPRQLDWDSLFAYFQLNYIPQPWTAISGVQQVRRGHYLRLQAGTAGLEEIDYLGDTSVVEPGATCLPGQAPAVFLELFGQAVNKRLLSDVPLGVFLSGGLDSSAVLAMASRQQPGIKTYTIGFGGDARYDEGPAARRVAEFFRSDHKHIDLTDKDMLAIVPAVLQQMDEPFGDSSALAVYLLSREVSKEVKVALSGDGGDELLGGYNKHAAELMVRQHRLLRALSGRLGFITDYLHGSRHERGGNRLRQLSRLIEGASLSPADRYWFWASFQSEARVRELLLHPPHLPFFPGRKDHLLRHIRQYPGDLNQVFHTDRKLVLQSDMLVKTDRMSMAHALEVRSPFVDQQLVSFCSGLPSSDKLRFRERKRVLRQAMAGILPQEVLHGRKQGFEVPLYKWLNGELRSSLTERYLEPAYLAEQGIFKPGQVARLLARLASKSPGDAAMQTWGLLVFQTWWDQYIKE